LVGIFGDGLPVEETPAQEVEDNEQPTNEYILITRNITKNKLADLLA